MRFDRIHRQNPSQDCFFPVGIVRYDLLRMHFLIHLASLSVEVVGFATLCLVSFPDLVEVRCLLAIHWSEFNLLVPLHYRSSVPNWSRKELCMHSRFQLNCVLLQKTSPSFLLYTCPSSTTRERKLQSRSRPLTSFFSSSILQAVETENTKNESSILVPNGIQIPSTTSRMPRLDVGAISPASEKLNLLGIWQWLSCWLSSKT